MLHHQRKRLFLCPRDKRPAPAVQQKVCQLLCVCDSDYAPCLYAETDRAVFVNSKAPKPEPVERGETAAKISHHSHRREPGEVNEWVLYMCTLSEGMCLPHFNSLYYYYSCYILSRCPMFTSNHTDAMISLF